MTKAQPINSMIIPEPCSEPWENMNGSAIKRFCGSCRKDVFNLSDMSRREANRLIRKSGGRICVRYEKLPNGRVVTADTYLYQITRKTVGIAAGVLATTISMSALTYAQGAPSPKMGSVPGNQPSAEQAEILMPFDQIKPNEKTSQISIVVVDETGAVIPGASVKLIDEESKKGARAYTGPDGAASFSMLRRSSYRVEAAFEGFRTNNRTVRLTLDLEPNIKMTLAAGTVTGFVIDGSYEIPVFDLIAKNDIDGFSAAIAFGFDVKTKDWKGRTALHIAVYHLRPELVKLLVEKGAEVNAKDKDGKTLLTLLADDIGEDDEDVVEILRFFISKGVDLDSTERDGKTILMEAAYFDDPVVVEMLLEAGAKTDLKDKNGITAYQKIEDERIREIFHRYGVFR